jgi:hypothetical protein
LIAIPALLLIGCADETIELKRSGNPEALRPAPAAAALAYERPWLQTMEPAGRLDLDAQLARSERGPAALLGFDSPTFESLYVRTNDRQVLGGTGGGFYSPYYGYGSGWYDRYDRRAISQRSFTRVRPPSR